MGDVTDFTNLMQNGVTNALKGINIRMVSQGASLRNLGFVVASEDADRCIEILHQELFSELDPSVFGQRGEA